MLGHISHRLTQSPLLLSAMLFVLAVAVRLPYLSTFLTIDEIKWVEGAGQFLLALDSGDLAQTYWHFFPGITTTWGEALILWLRWFTLGNGLDLPSYITAQFADQASLIGPMRLSGVLITSLAIPGLYVLARPLLGNEAALLGSALLAVNPFFVAHSRIVNGDAITAAFMLLSVFAFLWLWQGSGLRMAILSGAMGGLAMLTKLPAPIIIPWIGMLALIGYIQRRSIGFWVQALAWWGLTAIGIFVVLWPAMWVAPLASLQQMYHDAFAVGEVSAGHSTFFMEQISDDPSWAFYPVAIAFRLTPLTTIGLGLTVFWLVFGRQEKRAFAHQVSWSLVAYILFVVLCANFSPKKLDRYVMGVFPALDILVATGLWGIWQGLTMVKPWLRRGSTILALAIVGGQGAFTLIHYPYVLTSYNPLLGGPAKAVATVPVGWGEGLEQAATWLNSQPNAKNLEVAAWYSDIFFPYFVGEQASFSDDGRAQLAADYVVFYVNQIQRQKPYSGLVEYFRADEPVFVVAVDPAGQVVNLSNVEESRGQVHWVEVYKAPAARSASGAPKIEGVAQLLAYKVEGNRVADKEIASSVSELSGEDDLSVTLFLRVLGPLPEGTTFNVALVPISSPQNTVWGDWQLEEVKGEWLEEKIVEWPGTLALSPDMPPGEYRLWAVLQSEDSPVIVEFSISDKDPAISIE